MQKVLGGCKLCGKPMQTNRSPLIHRTCDACKDEQLRESNRQAHRPPQGQTPRRQGNAEAAAVPAVWQSHRGCPHADTEWAMGAKVLRH